MYVCESGYTKNRIVCVYVCMYVCVCRYKCVFRKNRKFRKKTKKYKEMCVKMLKEMKADPAKV